MMTSLIERFQLDVKSVDRRAATPNLSPGEREALRVQRNDFMYALGVALLADEGEDLMSIEAAERRAVNFLRES